MAARATSQYASSASTIRMRAASGSLRIRVATSSGTFGTSASRRHPLRRGTQYRGELGGDVGRRFGRRRRDEVGDPPVHRSDREHLGQIEIGDREPVARTQEGARSARPAHAAPPGCTTSSNSGENANLIRATSSASSLHSITRGSPALPAPTTSLVQAKCFALSPHSGPRSEAHTPSREIQSCHSPAFTTSPSRSTASPPVSRRPSTRRSAMRASGCTSGCSPPASGARAEPPESTTRSPSATARHRRRDHGRQQVRPARLAGRRGLEGLVGPEPAVPLADLRAHPPPAAPDRDGGRHDVPLPRRLPRGGARGGPRGRRRAGRADRRRRHRDPRLRRGGAGRPHAPGPGPDRARPRRHACGTASRHSRRTTTSRPSPRPAASPT